MSDYYGDATLEDWLAEEVFSCERVPEAVVALFERWREPVESSISSWQESDDGEGNRMSWRGWGRGFAGIEDTEAFEVAVVESRALLDNAAIAAAEKGDAVPVLSDPTVLHSRIDKRSDEHGVLLVTEPAILIARFDKDGRTNTSFPRTAEGLREAARVLGAWMELPSEGVSDV